MARGDELSGTQNPLSGLSPALRLPSGYGFLILSKISAIHPPSKPPPMMAVSNSTNLTSHNDPWACITSRMPPCNMMTANAIVVPIRNHQPKTLNECHMRRSLKLAASIQATVLDRFGKVHLRDVL